MRLLNLCPHVVVTKEAILFPNTFEGDGVEASVEFYTVPLFGFTADDFERRDGVTFLTGEFSVMEHEGNIAFMQNYDAIPGIVLIYPFPYHKRRVRFLRTESSVEVIGSFKTKAPDFGSYTSKILYCEGIDGSKNAIFEYKERLNSLWISWDLKTDWVEIKPDYWLT